MNATIVYVHVQALVNKSLTNHLHGKAAELAVLTEITVYNYNSKEKPKNLRNLSCSRAEACLRAETLKRYHR